MRYLKPMVRMSLLATIIVTVATFGFGSWLDQVAIYWAALFGFTPTALHVLTWIILILVAANFLAAFHRAGQKYACTPKTLEVLLAYKWCWFTSFLVLAFICYGALEGLLVFWSAYLRINKGLVGVPLIFLALGVALPFFIGYGSFRRQSPQRVESSGMGALLRLCSDNPIDAPEEDRLGRDTFVHRLYRIIDEYEGRDPLVLGITGRWGEGKTSVLNLLKLEAEAQGSRSTVVRFNPWYFSGQGTLIREFFKTLALTLGHRWVIPDLSKHMSTVARLLQSTTVNLGLISINLGRVDFRWGIGGGQEEEIVQLKENLKESLGNVRQKVIVLIDDIDRLTSDEGALIFKLVRQCADFPGFVYVLFYDREIACEVLKDAGIPDPGGFLEKIVQIDLRLPIADKTRITEFVATGLDQVLGAFAMSLNEDDAEMFRKLYQEHLGDRIRNLRDAKKLQAGLIGILPQVKGEVNTVDTIALESLRLFERSVWDDIADSLEFYVVPSGTEYFTRRLLWGLTQEDDVLQRAKKHLEDTLSGDNVSNPSFAKGIVEFLFPAASDALRGQSGSYESFQAGYDRGHRVALQDYLKKYLLQHVPVGIISSAEVTALLDEANGCSSPDEGASAAVEAFSGHGERDLLYDLIQKLIYLVDKLEPQGDAAMAKAISEYSDRFSLQPLGLRDSEMDRARALLYALANKHKDSEKIQHVLKDAIVTSRSMYFASSVIIWCTPDSNRIIKSFDNINVTHLKDAYKERFKREYVGPKKDILATDPSVVRYLLYPIDDRALSTAYMLSLFERRPAHAGTLLLLYATDRHVSTDPKRWIFQYDDLKAKFEIEKLYDFAKTHKDEAYETDDDKWAVETFLKLHEQKTESPQASQG